LLSRSDGDGIALLLQHGKGLIDGAVAVQRRRA
jgi:hypothetical protein